MRTRPRGALLAIHCGSLDAVGSARPAAKAGDADIHRAPGCARGLEATTAVAAEGDGLERDVVVARGRARPTAGRGGREVVRVDGDVRAGAEAVARRAAVVPRAREELDGVGDDVDRLALVALLLPLAPLEAAVDRDRAALGEVASAVLALRAPDGDVEVVGLVDPLTGRVVLAARVARNAQLAHRGAARQRAQLGIGREVAGDDHPVDVRRGHARTAPFGVARKRRKTGAAECRPGFRRSRTAARILR